MIMAEKKVLEARATAELGMGVLRPGTVRVVVEEGINLKNLHEIVDRVVNLHGCTACGLGGIDLLFRVREKILFDRFKDIEGIADVSVIR
jgi:hypothetical protein